MYTRSDSLRISGSGNHVKERLEAGETVFGGCCLQILSISGESMSWDGAG
jgi:hypothetical protein